MKRFFSRFLFVVVIVALVLPLTSTVAAPYAYREGIEIHVRDEWETGYTYMDLRATKLVDGHYRHTTINIQVDTARWYIEPQVLVLDSDPDYLEVSRDLGWGGLEADWPETTLLVWTTFKDTGKRELVPIWIVLNQRANESHSHYHSDGYFYRSANAIGSVNINYYVTWINQTGYNFSDQWPGR